MPLRKKNGKWEYRFCIENRRVTKLTDFAAIEPERRKAEKLERRHRERILRGLEPAKKPKPILFTKAVEEFLQHCWSKHRSHPNTARRVETSTASLVRFFSTRILSAVSPPEIERYKAWRINQCQVRDVTLRHDLDALSKFFEWALAMQLVTVNPVRMVEKPSIEEAIRMHIISDSERSVYLEQAKLRSIDLHDVAVCMDTQGMRPDEVIQIEVANVDLESRTLRISQGKTKAARRTLRLSSEATEVITRRIVESQTSFGRCNDSGLRRSNQQSLSLNKVDRREALRNRYLFPARRVGKLGKGHISLSGLEKMHDDVLSACRLLGQSLSFVLYDFRHTWATNAAQDGMPLATLASILGHSSLRQVQKYVHPTQDHQQREMDRLDQIRQQRRGSQASLSHGLVGPLQAQSVMGI